ncbi:MAG: glycogen/starch synthase [Betaproteobacteria bacterium]|jgi:starch synthase|nr:MAG: glycogen/starch synthase [Betaproteobacteria bacterium]
MTLHVLMVAAENDALPGGKVGGIGDVLRDLPLALTELGCRVTVVTPSYGRLADLRQLGHVAALEVAFRRANIPVEVVEVAGREHVPQVRHIVFDHVDFSPCGRGTIYCDDPPDRPFATDASKFALFNAAVAEALKQYCIGEIDVVHLHDWHSALLLLLRRYHPAYRKLRSMRFVYTLHNLALQGVRPLRGDPSALESWFPGLRYAKALVTDPRWPDCINPMAVGIRLADAVHTVSPSYCDEILRPSDVAGAGYYGGEGLQADLVAARQEGRLHGFLNGCDYPDQLAPVPEWSSLLELMRAENLRWTAARAQVGGAHFVAHVRLSEMSAKRPTFILSSVGRITSQKVRLLAEHAGDGRAALEGVLDALGDDGLLVILGSGDPVLEQFLAMTSARRRNLLYLSGYSDVLSQALYGSGDLFLMPSSFEPCGISQMLAMRSGQPCLVHLVGGLKDTVKPGINGFGFEGKSLLQQADGLLAALREALVLRSNHPRRWSTMRKAAARARFSWRSTAENCLNLLYRAG